MGRRWGGREGGYAAPPTSSMSRQLADGLRHAMRQVMPIGGTMGATEATLKLQQQGKHEQHCQH